MEKKHTLLHEFTKGIIKENPVLRLVLGCCATLAITTAASNAIGMGAATTFVLVCSNGVISLLRKVILLIPLAIALPMALGDVMGIYIAEPIADALASATTLTLFIRKRKTLLPVGPDEAVRR